MATTGIVPGKLIQFMITGVVMGCSDKCTLKTNTSSTSAVCKGDGDWEDSVVGQNSWGIDVSGFVKYDAAKTITEVVAAQIAQAGGAGIPVKFGTLIPGDPLYWGNCMIEAVTQEAGVSGAATYSFNVKGKGILNQGINPVAPTIASFFPAAAAIGSGVIVRGSGFTGATAVSFNNIAAASFQVVSDIEIYAVVGATATDGAVRVVTPNGTGVSATNFDVS